MKAWGLFWVCLIGLTTNGLAQDTSLLMPQRPLRLDFNRRLQPHYIDSVITTTRLVLNRVETMPRSLDLDTLRFELLIHLSDAYRYVSAQRQDSVLLAARQLTRLGENWQNVRFQVRGLLLEEYYYSIIKKDYPKALQTNYEALRVAETHPPTASRYRWRIERNLGKISNLMKRFNEAIQLFKQAMNHVRQDPYYAQDKLVRADLLQLVGESFKQSNQLDSAASYMTYALTLVQQNGGRDITSLAYLHGDLAIIYRLLARYPEALVQFRMAENYWQHLNSPNGLAITWSGMAQIFYLMHDYDKTLDYAQKALAYDKGIPTTRLVIYEMIALASAQKQDWIMAFRFHQRFKAVADSLQAQRKLTETLTLQSNFEQERLRLEQQQTQQLQEQRYLTLAKEKELQEQQLLTLEKDAELQQFQGQAEQQRLRQLAKQTDLQRRLETQRLKAETQTQQNQQQNQIRTLQVTDLRTRLQLQESTRIFWLVLASLIGLSLLGYNQMLRRKNRALHQANDEIKAAMQHGQTQEMAALRAQMNPHFLFNCINSIKLYTLQNDTDKAAEYLTKFSRLLRMVLENSRSELVSLHYELEALQLYIELEAMRFKQKVQFTIQVSPEIDQQYVCIPPLLLQPYVENAIWHGLMHKPEGGTVSVEVSQPQDNLLHIEITDDGVGRERAGELKSKSAGKHKSFGMQVTADRIRMINQLYNTHTQAQVLDLVDSFGQACGTRVTLDIPV